MPTHPVLIAGQWRPAQATGTFRAENPAAGEPLPEEYPVSAWEDVASALEAATRRCRRCGPHRPRAWRSSSRAYAERSKSAPPRSATWPTGDAWRIAASRRVSAPYQANHRASPPRGGRGSLAFPHPTPPSQHPPPITRRSDPSWYSAPTTSAAFNSAAGATSAAIAAGNPSSLRPQSHRVDPAPVGGVLGAAGHRNAHAIVQLIYRTAEDGERLVAATCRRGHALHRPPARGSGSRPLPTRGQPITSTGELNPLWCCPRRSGGGTRSRRSITGSSSSARASFARTGPSRLLAGESSERSSTASRSAFEAAAVNPCLLERGQVAGASIRYNLQGRAPGLHGGPPASASDTVCGHNLLRGRARVRAEPEKLLNRAFARTLGGCPDGGGSARSLIARRQPDRRLLHRPQGRRRALPDARPALGERAWTVLHDKSRRAWR